MSVNAMWCIRNVVLARIEANNAALGEAFGALELLEYVSKADRRIRPEHPRRKARARAQHIGERAVDVMRLEHLVATPSATCG